MNDWLLYIDESGDLEDEGKVACVGGLLLQERDAAKVGDVLRKLLEAVYPHVRYPPHAADLNLAAGHLAAWMLARVPHPLAERLGNAERMFEAHLSEMGHAPSVNPFLNALARREMPAFRDLALCNAWMAQFATDALAALEEVRRECDERLVSSLAQAADRLRSRRRELVLLAAVDMGRTVPLPDGRPTEERYLRLLRVLFEKAYLVLRDGAPGPHPRQELRVTVAGRGVQGATRPITVEDVEREKLAAAAFPLYPPSAGDSCRIVNFRVAVQRRYDGTAPAGIVFADFLMNRLRQELRQEYARWSDIERGLARKTGLPASVPPRIDVGVRRPTVAVDRAPWRLITDAFRLAGANEPIAAATSLDVALLQPSWAKDCVRSWSELAERLP
jgi:hypothetical protein